MMVNVGRNINSNDVATVTRVTVNSVTATTIANANPERINLSVCLAHSTIDVDVAVRAYPAATDNNLDGEILTRHTVGNANLFRPSWTMPTDNPYIGELSAMSESGLVDIIVTEW
jgi:hypothetical protein